MDTMFQSGDADEDINQKAEDKTPTRRIGHEMLDVARTTNPTTLKLRIYQIIKI